MYWTTLEISAPRCALMCYPSSNITYCIACLLCIGVILLNKFNSKSSQTFSEYVSSGCLVSLDGVSLSWNPLARATRCAVASFFSGYAFGLIGTILGRFSINYFRGLGLRIMVRVWVRVWVRVRVRVGVRGWG